MIKCLSHSLILLMTYLDHFMQAKTGSLSGNSLGNLFKDYLKQVYQTIETHLNLAFSLLNNHKKASFIDALKSTINSWHYSNLKQHRKEWVWIWKQYTILNSIMDMFLKNPNNMVSQGLKYLIILTIFRLKKSFLVKTSFQMLNKMPLKYLLL